MMLNKIFTQTSIAILPSFAYLVTDAPTRRTSQRAEKTTGDTFPATPPKRPACSRFSLLRYSSHPKVPMGFPKHAPSRSHALMLPPASSRLPEFSVPENAVVRKYFLRAAGPNMWLTHVAAWDVSEELACLPFTYGVVRTPPRPEGAPAAGVWGRVMR